MSENKIPSKIQSGLLDTFRPDSEQVMASIQQIVLQELLHLYSTHLVEQFMSHGMVVDENDDLTTEQVVRIKQQIGIDAIRAAVMDVNYWENVTERIADCIPRFQELSRDSTFVDLVVAQKSDEIAKLLQDSVFKRPTFPTFEESIDDETETCTCDGCQSILNADNDWEEWKPFDKTSAHFKETIDKISANL